MSRYNIFSASMNSSSSPARNLIHMRGLNAGAVVWGVSAAAPSLRLCGTLFAICLSAQFHSLHKNGVRGKVKGDAVLTDSKPMRSRREVHHGRGTYERISKRCVLAELPQNAALNFSRQRAKFSVPARSELNFVHRALCESEFRLNLFERNPPLFLRFVNR